MENERWKPKMVRANPDLYVMVRVTAEGLEIEDPVQMNEKEYRRARKETGHRGEEIDKEITDAQAKFIP